MVSFLIFERVFAVESNDEPSHMIMTCHFSFSFACSKNVPECALMMCDSVCSCCSADGPAEIKDKGDRAEKKPKSSNPFDKYLDTKR